MDLVEQVQIEAVQGSHHIGRQVGDVQVHWQASGTNGSIGSFGEQGKESEPDDSMVAVHNGILESLGLVEVEFLALVSELEHQVDILALDGARVGDPGVDGVDL